MPQIGPLEVMVVALVALIVFGPHKLPGMARSAGRTLNQLKRAASEMQQEVDAVKREVKEGLTEDEPGPTVDIAPEEPVGEKVT